MGSRSSAPVHDICIYSNEPNLVKWKPLFEGLYVLESDVGLYHSLFQSLDTEQSGFVDTLNLIKYLDVHGNTFMEGVLSLQNSNQSTLIDFRSFVLVLWNFCTLDHMKTNVTAMFIFDMYDTGHKGALSPDKVTAFIKDLYGDTYEHNKHAIRLNEMVMRLGDLGMMKQFFLDFVKSHPSILDPIIAYQKSIKTKVFGVKFWKQAARNREKLSGEKAFEPLRDIVERIIPAKKARRRRRSMSKSMTSKRRRSHTEDDSDSSSSDDDGTGRGGVSLSLNKLVKMKSQSSLGSLLTPGSGGDRKDRLSRGSRESRGSRDSFSSEGGSDKRSNRGSFDNHSMGSLCDEEPAAPRLDKVTGKVRRSIGSDGGSLVDDNEWDDFDRKMSELIVKKKSSKHLSAEENSRGDSHKSRKAVNTSNSRKTFPSEQAAI